MNFMEKYFLRSARSFVKDDGGQFAVWGAIVGLPLLVGVGVVLDTGNLTRETTNLKAALDSAALAAVLPDGITDAERQAYSEEVFRKNYSGKTINSVTVQASRNEVEISAEISVPSLLGGLSGKRTVGMRDHSKAVLTKSDTICVLALDEESPYSLVFDDSAVFSAPTCSVQANSRSPQAVWSATLTPPKALNFCSAGGAIGNYNPRVKADCSQVADPYKDLEIPPAAASCDQNRQVIIKNKNGKGRGRAFLESQLITNLEGESLIPDHATLKPGIYCRGLEVSGANVTLEPGVYHVWGGLTFTQNAGVYGNGVTFILKGEDTPLMIEDGAQVWLKAPAEGLTEGLVIWQRYLKMGDYVSGIVPDVPKRLTSTSEINSGGGLTLIGTAYLPNHKLKVTSSSAVTSQSPATSFIAYQIEFSGRTNMQVAVDHVAAGLPPLKPYTDDGARLVK